MTRPPHRRALVFIAITVLLDVIGFGLIMPVMPALLVELTGKSVNAAAIEGGWLAFAYAGMQFLCAPILGNLSDRFGRRPVLLAAIGAFGLDYIVMGLAPTFAWLFVGRLIAGMAGASFTPAYAYVADVSPPEKRAQSFGIVSACFGVGFILGPALGGLIGGFGPRAPFFVAAALSLANFVYGWFALPESLPPEKRRKFDFRRANPIGTLVQIRKHREVVGILGALFLWMLAQQVMPATWSFYTSFRFGWSEALIGASLAAAGTMMALSQATLLRFAVPRVGERRAAIAGLVIAAAGNLGYATATQGWMMFAWLGTWYFGSIVMSSSNGLMSRLTPPEAQGELQGAVTGLFSLSTIVGPPLMTHVFARFSAPDALVRFPGAAFALAALLALASAAIYWRVTRGRAAAVLPHGPRPPRPAEGGEQAIADTIANGGRVN